MSEKSVELSSERCVLGTANLKEIETLYTVLAGRACKYFSVSFLQIFQLKKRNANSTGIFL